MGNTLLPDNTPTHRKVAVGPQQITSGVLPLLAMLGIACVLSLVLVIHDWPVPVHNTTVVVSPLSVIRPSFAEAPLPLQLPANDTILYEETQGIYAAAVGGQSQQLLTPGYIYNRSVPPLMGKALNLLYSGDGIWEMNLISRVANRVAKLPDGQVITSMALSQDGTMLAWSTEPENGQGDVSLYAGPIDATQLVWQRPVAQSPQLRVFSFSPGSDTQLLLTNDRGDHRAVTYGLWSFDFTGDVLNPPQLVLSDHSEQMPLALSPDGKTLLYAPYSGFVTAPEVNIPDDVSSLAYANGLSLASMQGAQSQLTSSQILLPVQSDQIDVSSYHWVASPLFSPAGNQVVYIDFSSSSQIPFLRSYALFSVSTDKNNPATAALSEPQLLATISAAYTEFDGWLDNHTVIIYADGTFYAFDLQLEQLAPIVRAGAYARSIAILS